MAAAAELRYLLDRGYPKKSSLRFVGDHHQLRQEERDLLFRGVFATSVAEIRRRKLVRPGALKGAQLTIDGHNVLITLENCLKGRPFLVGQDGFVRDVSRVFRSYRPTELTREAWSLVLQLLADYRPSLATVLLDAPLAFSAKLKGQIQRWTREAGIAATVKLSATPEREMAAAHDIIATADSVVLDRAAAIFDIAGHIIRRRLRQQPLIRF